MRSDDHQLSYREQLYAERIRQTAGYKRKVRMEDAKAVVDEKYIIRKFGSMDNFLKLIEIKRSNRKKANTYAVYDYLLEEYVFTGTKEEVYYDFIFLRTTIKYKTYIGSIDQVRVWVGRYAVINSKYAPVFDYCNHNTKIYKRVLYYYYLINQPSMPMTLKEFSDSEKTAQEMIPELDLKWLDENYPLSKMRPKTYERRVLNRGKYD